ncbi:MAG: hypothetical protein AAF557_24260 [Pseudomonadota bacterium]
MIADAVKVMIRRKFLTGVAALVASPAAAHSLYGQWVAYRRRNLLIGCHRKDPATFELAQALVADINHALPKAKATPARAPHPERLASLLGTDQMELAVLSNPVARAIAEGLGKFHAYGTIPLLQVAGLGGHALIAHAEFPDRHAWMIRSALSGSAILDETEPSSLPWHPGAVAFEAGEPVPGIH